MTENKHGSQNVQTRLAKCDQTFSAYLYYWGGVAINSQRRYPNLQAQKQSNATRMFRQLAPLVKGYESEMRAMATLGAFVCWRLSASQWRYGGLTFEICRIAFLKRKGLSHPACYTGQAQKPPMGLEPWPPSYWAGALLTKLKRLLLWLDSLCHMLGLTMKKPHALADKAAKW